MTKIGEIKLSREIGLVGHHRHIWHACESCGKERWVQLLNGLSMSKHCQSCVRRGNRNSLKSGRYYSHGYVLVKLYPDDFFFPMVNSDGYVFEHRLVMARHLGRCLQPWELVHHKDGVKDHNVYKNLRLTMRGEHALEHSRGYRDGYREGYQQGYEDGKVLVIDVPEYRLKVG